MRLRACSVRSRSSSRFSRARSRKKRLHRPSKKHAQRRCESHIHRAHRQFPARTFRRSRHHRNAHARSHRRDVPASKRFVRTATSVQPQIRKRRLLKIRFRRQPRWLARRSLGSRIPGKMKPIRRRRGCRRTWFQSLRSRHNILPRDRLHPSSRALLRCQVLRRRRFNARLRALRLRRHFRRAPLRRSRPRRHPFNRFNARNHLRRSRARRHKRSNKPRRCRRRRDPFVA